MWFRKISFIDFLVDNTQLVEIKPNRLRQCRNVFLKKSAAEIFCKKSGYKYVMIEPEMLPDCDIKKMYQDGRIRFTARYNIKFKAKYLNEE